MTRKKALLLAGGAVLALGVGVGTATAAVNADSDDDAPIPGNALEQATAAALAHTGGGRVTETEVGDDGAAYEVEIELADGSQVEVELDEAFKVVGSEKDDDGPGDDDDDAGDDDD